MSDLVLRGQAAIERWRSERPTFIAADTETNTQSIGSKPDFDRMRDQAFCLTLSWNGKPEYVELLRDPEGPAIAREILMGTDNIAWHNAKFDLHMLINTGVLFIDDLTGSGWTRIHDTELLSRLHWEHGVGPQGSHALKALAREYLGVTTDEETILKEAKRTTKAASYDALPRKVVIPYALEDARITELLYNKLHAFVSNSPRKLALYNTERELLVRLLLMEREGMGVDIDALRTNTQVLDKHLKELRSEVKELVPNTTLQAGPYFDEKLGKERKRLKDKVIEFNPNSSKQLAEQLQQRGCELTRTTESGQLSTDEEVLTALSSKDRLAALVLDLRRKSKLTGTYLEPLTRRAYTDLDGVSRVTANFRVAAARTGRMSCTEPNLQNIPRQDKIIRSCFIPKRDELLYFDYSNVEMVIAAAFSEDERLCSALTDGADLHGLTARLLFGHPADEPLTDTERQVGKVVNFQALYGASGPRVKAELESHGLPTTIDEADGLLVRFWDAYPGLKELKERLEKDNKSAGYITTLAGRELHVDSEHKLINALIQGSAADLIEKAFIDVSTYLEENCKSRLVCVIHDELQIDALASETSELIKNIPAVMTDCPAITQHAPLLVDCEITRTTWADKGLVEVMSV